MTAPSAPKQITLRGPSDELYAALGDVAEREGVSMNALILRLLDKAVGVDQDRERWLRYATWTEEDYREFVDNTSDTRTIDEEMWT